jgi:polyhydroxyalkanoate synthesis regulator phasin
METNDSMDLPKPANDAADAASVEKLVGDLIDTGTMSAETTAELSRMRDEARAGTLDPDDRDYLEALHRRLLSSAPEPEKEAAEDLREALDAAIARAEAAEAEAQDLRAQIAALRAAAAPPQAE